MQQLRQPFSSVNTALLVIVDSIGRSGRFRLKNSITFASFKSETILPMKRILVLLSFSFLLALPLVTSAQPFPDDEPPCDGPFGGPCPIDGGIGFLIAAGIAFGGKKAHDISKKG